MRLILFISLLFCANHLAAQDTASDLKPGLYVGFLNNPQTNLKIPITLEAIRLTDLTEDDELVGWAFYLKRSYGSYVSHEYFVNYYFQSKESVTENIDLQDTSQSGGLTISLQVHDEGERLAGTFTAESLGLGNEGQIELLHASACSSNDRTDFLQRVLREMDERLFTVSKVFPSITGAYKSTCPFYEGVQIEAFRDGRRAFQTFSFPANNFIVTGRFSRYSEDMDSLLTITPFRNTRNFDYNLFSGRMEFPDPSIGICQQTGVEIKCDSCAFRKILAEKSLDEVFAMNGYSRDLSERDKSHQTKGLAVQNMDRPDFRKIYYGLLHYESTNTYQNFAIDLKRNTALPGGGDDDQEQLQVVPRFTIQNHDATDVQARDLILKVDEVTSSPEVGRAFFRSSTGNLFVVELWDDERMQGVFYSSGFGRVGRFELMADREAAPTSPIELPGLFIGGIKSKGDLKSQIQVLMEWQNNPNGFPLPHQLAGVFVHVTNRYNFRTNILSVSPINFMGFDPFASIFAGTTNGSRNAILLMGKVVGKEMSLINTSQFMGGRASLTHEIGQFSKEGQYLPLELPDDIDMSPNLIHVFYPANSRLFVNGQQILPRDFDERLHKVFTLPDVGDREFVTYEFKVGIGFNYEWSVTKRFRVADLRRRAEIVNMFEYQNTGPQAE